MITVVIQFPQVKSVRIRSHTHFLNQNANKINQITNLFKETVEKNIISEKNRREFLKRSSCFSPDLILQNFAIISFLKSNSISHLNSLPIKTSNKLLKPHQKFIPTQDYFKNCIKSKPLNYNKLTSIKYKNEKHIFANKQSFILPNFLSIKDTNSTSLFRKNTQQKIPISLESSRSNFHKKKTDTNLLSDRTKQNANGLIINVNQQPKINPQFTSHQFLPNQNSNFKKCQVNLQCFIQPTKKQNVENKVNLATNYCDFQQTFSNVKYECSDLATLNSLTNFNSIATKNEIIEIQKSVCDTNLFNGNNSKNKIIKIKECCSSNKLKPKSGCSKLGYSVNKLESIIERNTPVRFFSPLKPIKKFGKIQFQIKQSQAAEDIRDCFINEELNKLSWMPVVEVLLAHNKIKSDVNVEYYELCVGVEDSKNRHGLEWWEYATNMSIKIKKDIHFEIKNGFAVKYRSNHKN